MARAPFQTLTIVGVGLIGGSLALAARRRGLVQRVVGVGWRQASIDRALALKIMDEGTLDLVAGVAQADVAVFCTPVDRIAEQVLTTAPHCKPGVLLTDAGSTKGAIVSALDGKLPAGVVFVGSHPLAGSEKKGPEHADADLFEGRLTVVTPGSSTKPADIERTVGFWEALGARVRIMDSAEHDRALALTSHLPHLLASALAGILPAELHELAATGFRDTTRVASGDPTIWTGIFEHNREAVLDALDRVSERLQEFRASLTSQDRNKLDQLLNEGKKTRDQLGARGA